jgi:hypothetical protein
MGEENKESENDPNEKQSCQHLEEIDIDLNDPSVEKSATKIQATFRGGKARKEVAKIKEEKEKHATHDLEKSSTVMGSGSSDHMAQKEVAPLNEEYINNNKNQKVDSLEEIDIDLNDPNVEKSATKIQATFRGSKARKEVAHLKKENVKDSGLNPNLNAEKSATVIQSGYRGHMARKKVAKMRQENVEEIMEDSNGATKSPKCSSSDDTSGEKNHPEPDGSAINWQDPELNTIATSIQAGYKGMKVREQMKEKQESEAACKIQANFRGFQARRQVKRMRKDKEIQEKLGIDLEDPEVSRAATKIQAGFRGMKARRQIRENRNPHIVVEDMSEYTEMESETSYYEEDEDEEEALKERPPTPETSVERFSIDEMEPAKPVESSTGSGETKLKGFKAMAIVAKLMQTRKDKFEKRRSVPDVKSTINGEVASLVQNSECIPSVGDNGHIEEGNPEKMEVNKVICVQPSAAELSAISNDYSQNDDEFESSDESKDDEDEEEDDEDDDEDEQKEPDTVKEVPEDKKPFFLLKRLVGIMNLTGGPLSVSRSNKVGILEKVKETSKEQEEVPQVHQTNVEKSVTMDSKEQFKMVVTDVDTDNP